MTHEDLYLRRIKEETDQLLRVSKEKQRLLAVNASSWPISADQPALGAMGSSWANESLLRIWQQETAEE